MYYNKYLKYKSKYVNEDIEINNISIFYRYIDYVVYPVISGTINICTVFKK